MTGIFTIHHQPAVILFDSGATHSFINSKFGTKVGLDYYPTKEAYMIATPGGKIVTNQICRNVPIQFGSNLVKTDLLVLDLEGMDILLGMDWMTRHRVSLDISSRAVFIFFLVFLHYCSLSFTTEVHQLLCLCCRRNQSRGYPYCM
jgi:hypothetical protein